MLIYAGKVIFLPRIISIKVFSPWVNDCPLGQMKVVSSNMGNSVGWRSVAERKQHIAFVSVMSQSRMEDRNGVKKIDWMRERQRRSKLRKRHWGTLGAVSQRDGRGVLVEPVKALETYLHLIFGGLRVWHHRLKKKKDLD